MKGDNNSYFSSWEKEMAAEYHTFDIASSDQLEYIITVFWFKRSKIDGKFETYEQATEPEKVATRDKLLAYSLYYEVNLKSLMEALEREEGVLCEYELVGKRLEVVNHAKKEAVILESQILRY